jgi:type I restriction enzyme S subunit
MSFPRYPKYKPSGVEWLGEVPAHWEVKRLKFAAPLVTERAETRSNPVALENIEGWTGNLIPTETRFEGEGTQFRPGDVLFGKLRPYLAKIHLATHAGEAVGDFHVVRPTAEVYGRFLQHSMLRREFIDIIDGTTFGSKMPRASWEALGGMPTALPPLPEQRAIAAFLDRETAKIDGLVAEQRRLIELLKEKRQAVISHAVTKGLDPAAPMKPSGVEWLGEVPAHWEVIQSRRLFAPRSEPALATDRMLTASQKYGVLFQSDFVELEGRRVVEVIMGIESLKHVEPDDFIISMRSFQGGIEWCKLRGSTSFHYVMLRPIKQVHPPFFAHLLKSSTYIQALRATTDLIRDGQELRFSNFAQVELPLVPMEEQAAIAAFLDRETATIDALVAEAQSAITLFQERRSALISAAVTGQIDVRNATPGADSTEAA